MENSFPIYLCGCALPNVKVCVHHMELEGKETRYAQVPKKYCDFMIFTFEPMIWKAKTVYLDLIFIHIIKLYRQSRIKKMLAI